MKKIGDVISHYRREKKLSQIDIADMLQAYDIHITNGAVSSWEKGNSIPGGETLMALCEILEISDIYTAFIGENPNDPFRNLNEQGKNKALDYITLLEHSGEYEKPKTELLSFEPRIMKIALMPTSAGTGNYLDDENFTETEIYEPVPEKADFGVYLDGDSMEPRFKNGQLIWIEQTETLESGDIGLFFYNGMTFFKKLLNKETGTFLISLNPKYKPIPVTDLSDFKIYGRLAF
ncbi:MAG: XRE family transcriptional regulator [Lachnospiraceae bacterium]|nr:XRE family transcriptional regulator [Lachnospiraceae bacterium]